MEGYVFNKPKEIIDLSKPIIVSMESFQDLKDAKVVSDDGLDWYIRLMAFDVTSRNNNLYPMEDTKKSFNESQYIQEGLRNHTLYGELEHPQAGSELSRFLFVEPTRYAWNIETIEDKGDCYFGKVHLCDPLGTSIVSNNVKRFGSNLASSCRIYTPNFIEKTGQNGAKIYIKKYKMFPVTFDCVSIPGIPTCRLMPDGSAGAFGSGRSVESAGVVKFNNPAEQLKQMMKSQESSRILEDYFGADFTKKAILTKDNKLRMSTESGVDIIVPLNQHLLSDVLS